MKNELNKNSIAQGTIEYLVVIAVVVVLSLVVVALVINVSSSPSQQVLDSSDKLGNVAVGGISIVEAVSDLDGDSLIMLSNNSSEGITLKKITIGENDNNYDDYISGVDSVPISLTGLASSCPCESGQKNVKCEFVFEYLTKSGLTKIERRTINVQCTNSNEDPSSPSTRLITPTNSCGAIASLDGYVSIDDCSDVSGAGNYLFTQNMTCDITITANDVNIHGNNCTLTGNISGDVNTDSNGYSFNLIKLKANNVSSNNSIYPWDPVSNRSGGNITLVDSNVLGISSNGSASNDASNGSGSSGSGGIITLTNSSASSISSNAGNIEGGKGDLYAGSGGAVTLINSYVSGAISSNGGSSTGNGWNPSGGNGGIITLTNSSADGINSTGGSVVKGDSSGGKGGDIILSNSIVDDIITNGGSAYYLGLGGNGGNVNASSSTVDTITSNGARSYNTGGSGGTITLTNILGVTSISAIGAESDIQGGDGGIITFNPAVCPGTITPGSIYISGGTPSGSIGSVNPAGCGQ